MKLALALAGCLGLVAVLVATWLAIWSALPLWAMILLALLVVAVAASNP